jgi:hypothetical protein
MTTRSIVGMGGSDDVQTPLPLPNPDCSGAPSMTTRSIVGMGGSEDAQTPLPLPNPHRSGAPSMTRFTVMGGSEDVRSNTS